MTVYFNGENDNCVTLTGLLNKVTGAFVNDATATVSLFSATATLVAAQSMPYVAASDGVYRAVIDDAVDLSTLVRTEVTATAGDGSVYKSIEASKSLVRSFKS